MVGSELKFQGSFLEHRQLVHFNIVDVRKVDIGRGNCRTPFLSFWQPEPAVQVPHA